MWIILAYVATACVVVISIARDQIREDERED